MSLRIQPNQNFGQVIGQIEKTYTEFFPNELFDYSFEDERLAHYYEKESRLQQTFQAFALIAILIGGIGLFGLISFIATQKTKEIGIRKVLGASVTSIIRLISGEFIRLLILAFIIAAPLGYWLMHNWLEDFAYRIEIQVWVFLLAILLSLLITGLTVFYQTWRAARLNPIEALRYE